MLKLSINGGDVKEYGTAAKVYEVLNTAYLALEDQYAGELLWFLGDGEQLIMEKMPCALFYANCEDVRSFRSWLSMAHGFKLSLSSR